MADVLSLLSGAAGSALEKTEVVVDGNWLPPIPVSLASEPGPPSAFLGWLKPRVTVLVDGQAVATSAPYGEPVPPSAGEFWAGLACVLIGAGVAGYLLWR